LEGDGMRRGGGVMPVGKKYYVDVAIPNSRQKKKHAVYDGERVFKIDDLRKLPDAEEVYLDALLPRIFDEVEGLLERGVKVYVLTRTKVLKMVRQANGLVKSDENDAVALSMTSPACFRELTLDRLLLEEDVARYWRLSRMISTLRKWRTDRDLDCEVAIQLIRQLDAERKAVGRRIIKRVKSDPFYGELYRRAMEGLGLSKGAASIAVLLVKLPLHLNKNKLKVYLGFTPEAKKTRRYNHELRGWLARFAAIICLRRKRTCNRKAIYKTELTILKTLKRIYREFQRGGGAYRPMSGRGREAGR